MLQSSMAKVKQVQKGFTLIEILIAMSIFALIAIGAVQILTGVTDSNDLSEQRFESLQELQRAMLIIERDFLQMVPRKSRVEGDVSEQIVVAGRFAFNSSSDGLGFVRAGWHNPQLALRRSTLQAVAYRVQENQLQRLYSTYVDNVVGFEPKIRVLLNDVESVKFEFLKQFSDIEFNWEEAEAVDELPIAVAIIIESEVYGQIRREFKVRR
jgi:general secretion pathway protein J